jgi:hypothetical protein
MNEQAWKGNLKALKENAELNLDGVCLGSGLVDMMTDKHNSRGDQPPSPINASW